MRGRNGEIDDDLDRRIAQEHPSTSSPDAELGAARFGCGRLEVGDRPDVEDRKDFAALR